MSFGSDGGPQLRFWVDNNGNTNWFGYPDANFIISRTWDLAWEGILPQTARLSGIVQSAGALGSAAGVLSDAGADFQSSGVQVGDVLMFTECRQNSDCQPDDWYSCQVAIVRRTQHLSAPGQQPGPVADQSMLPFHGQPHALPGGADDGHLLVPGPQAR